MFNRTTILIAAGGFGVGPVEHIVSSMRQLTHPAQVVEERNADHLLEQGSAIRCNNLPVLAWKIDRLLDDPARLSMMQKRARQLGRPRAANEIADALLAGTSGRE